MQSMKTYLYRCTEQQLEAHLQRIAEAGDTVEHVVFKGGRDYVLVCRPAGSVPVMIVAPTPEFWDQLREVTRGIRQGSRDGARAGSGR